jgi:hypothetical protein
MLLRRMRPTQIARVWLTASNDVTAASLEDHLARSLHIRKLKLDATSRARELIGTCSETQEDRTSVLEREAN